MIRNLLLAQTKHPPLLSTQNFDLKNELAVRHDSPGWESASAVAIIGCAVDLGLLSDLTKATKIHEERTRAVGRRTYVFMVRATNCGRN